MEMHQIRYFLAVCETLNFTRAAEQCNVSQPALTRAVKVLEDEFGGLLFHRERNNTHLTELGGLIQPYLSEIYTQTAEAKTQAEKFAQLEDITLKIGVMCTIGPSVISGFLIAYSQSHPSVEIKIVDDTANALKDLLMQGEIEVALYGQPDGVGEDYHALPLFSEPFVIVVNKDHRLAKLPQVRCCDLDGERYVSRANCEIYDYAGEIMVQRGARLNRVFSSERDDWVQGMISAGLGLGFFPALSVTEQGIVSRPLVDPEIIRTINLVTPRGRPHSPAVGAFVREARRYNWPDIVPEESLVQWQVTRKNQPTAAERMN